VTIAYLDNCATTPCRAEVIEAMTPLLAEMFGNPSSPHMIGKRARRETDRAIAELAVTIGATVDEIVITSGATESNNIALQGAFGVNEKAPANAVLCPTDHKSVLEVGKALSARGIGIRMARVDRRGLVDLDELTRQVDQDTRVVSMAWVNSELGTVQPVSDVAQICHRSGALLHLDAAQALGRLMVDVGETAADLMSISAHKVFGPKGVGALFVRASASDRIRPITFGGGQSRLRSGTLATHLIVGFACAARLAAAEAAEGAAEARRMRARALEILRLACPDLVENSPSCGVPHILNVSLPGVATESLVSSLRKVAIATGSACNSAALEPSYVLRAIGLSDDLANSAIRICLDPRMDQTLLESGLRELGERAEALRRVSMQELTAPERLGTEASYAR
jgi:cysteine desulfurase